MNIHGTSHSQAEAKAYERAARLRTDVDISIQSTQDPGDGLALGNKIAEKTRAQWPSRMPIGGKSIL